MDLKDVRDLLGKHGVKVEIKGDKLHFTDAKKVIQALTKAGWKHEVPGFGVLSDFTKGKARLTPLKPARANAMGFTLKQAHGRLASKVADIHLAAVRGEEVLRTSFLPDDVLGGTKLFLTFEGDTGQYVVRTRFQDWFRSQKGYKPNEPRARTALSKATKVFEDMLMGKMPRGKAAAGATPVKVHLTDYGAYFWTMISGFGQIYRLKNDLDLGEKKVLEAMQTARPVLDRIEGVYTDWVFPSAQPVKGSSREMTIYGSIRFKGGVERDTLAEIEASLGGVRGVHGFAPLPKSI